MGHAGVEHERRGGDVPQPDAERVEERDLGVGGPAGRHAGDDVAEQDGAVPVERAGFRGRDEVAGLDLRLYEVFDGHDLRAAHGFGVDLLRVQRTVSGERRSRDDRHRSCGLWIVALEADAA